MKSAYDNIDISLLETKVPEEIYLASEEISDAEQISGLSQNKDKEWEATVVDNNMHFSVVAEVKRSKLKYCSCNCSIFSKEQMCPHLVATLIKLRKNLEKKKLERKARTVTKRRTTSFDLNSFINQISADELKTFVLAKAKSDKNFKLLLQARFIEKISTDQLAPFIESTFPVLTKANEKVQASKLRAFIDITEELLNHFKNLIAQSDFIEAYEFAFLLLKKSFYIKFHLKNDNARFYRLHKLLLKNYIEVYKLIEAPEYKDGITNQLAELLRTSYISAALKEEKDLWMQYYLSDNSNGHIQEMITYYLDRHIDGDYNSYYFIKMLELLITDSEEERIKLINVKDLQECYRIIQYLISYSGLPACQSTMQLFYAQKNLSHPLSKAIIESLLVTRKNKKELIAQSITYYIKYKDSAFLTFIRENASNWKETRGNIIKEIEKSNSEYLLISFLIECEEIDEAIKQLKSNLSWSLLRRFDEVLAEQQPEQCKELFYLTIEEYVTDHFGAHAQDFTREIFNRISTIDQRGWLTDLKLRLAKRFPDRKGLYR